MFLVFNHSFCNLNSFHTQVFRFSSVIASYLQSGSTGYEHPITGSRRSQLTATRIGEHKRSNPVEITEYSSLTDHVR